MILNQRGEIAQRCWLEVPQHFKIIELDEYVIMPNHVHGIIVINDAGDFHLNVGDAYMRPPQNTLLDRTKMLLSKAIQQYIAAVSREIHKMENDNNFQWKKSFYDHIIRNDFSLLKIRTYLQTNPMKWGFDQENNNEISLAKKKKLWGRFLRDVLNES